MIKPVLTRFHRRYRRLRLLGALARTIGLASVLLLGMVWADRLAAFPGRTRLGIALAAAAITGAYLIAKLIDVLLISCDHVALCVDRHLASAQHAVLTAWQLESKPDAGRTPTEAALAAHHINQAVEAVSRLKPRHVFPVRLFARQCQYLAAAAVSALVLAIWGGWSIFPRYFEPYADHPPYSHLTFTVSPDPARVAYGDDIEVKVTIGGGSPEEVRLVTEDETSVRQSPCFRAGPQAFEANGSEANGSEANGSEANGSEANGSEANTFTQRIEKVTRPLKFWFAAGQARSRWQRLDLILTPKIVSLKITIIPPDYTLQSPQSFLVGQKPVRALKGSRIELTAFSNRPLSDGVLSIQPVEGREAPAEVKATRKSATHSVGLTWQVNCSAQLKLALVDVDGNRSREEFTFYQEAFPDNKPEIIFEHPKPLVLATPKSKVLFRILAHDDYGLKDLRLFRSLKNFRETVCALPVEQAYVTDSSQAGAFDMAALGVRVGDEIEYLAEARDYNPSGVGISATDVYCIRVISEEDYMELQRSRARLEEFQERYAAIQQKLGRLAEDAKELEKAVKEENEARAAEARLRLAADARDLDNMLGKYLDAEPLYDIEKEFQDQLRPMGRQLRQLVKMMDDKASDKEMQEFIGRLVAEQGAPTDGIVDQVNDLVQAAEAKALENEFLEIVKAQSLLERRLAPLKARTVPVAELKPYAEEQKAIEERLRKFVEAIERQSAQLPEDLAELKESMQKFLDELKKLNPQADMADCRTACEAGRSGPAHTAAKTAYEKLRSLITVCDGGGLAAGTGMCRGFRPVVMKTSLEQLMKGMGLGPGRAGFGAAGQSGYSMNMPTAANSDLAGPAVTGGSMGGTQGHGPGRDAATSQIEHVVRETPQGVQPRSLRFKFDPNEPFPERYREQLIDYFKRVTQEPQK